MSSLNGRNGGSSHTALISFKKACNHLLPQLTDRDFLEASLFLSCYVEERNRARAPERDPNQGVLELEQEGA